MINIHTHTKKKQ